MPEPSSADPRERFARLAALPDAELDLEEASLLIAAEEYPDLDLDAMRSELDSLASTAADRLAGVRGERDRIERLNRFLFEEEGFAGDREDYHDPRNSYLNEVLDRRRGIPISLSLVFICVARRLGIDARGICFPGHFLVKCVGDEETLVDAFEGRTLSVQECAARLSSVAGRQFSLRPDVHLRAAGAREILMRMLNNLKQIFAEQRDLERLLGVCDRMLLLAPDTPLELRDRALVYERLACYAAAAADLDAALALLPNDPLAGTLRARRDVLRARIGKLH